MARKPKRRRVMTAFKMNEISAVDRPAQEGARMTIMKRQDDADEIAKKAALTTEVEGHSHSLVTEDGRGIATNGYTSYVDGHEHPWILGEGGEIIIGSARGHSHQVSALSKSGESTETEEKEVNKMTDKTKKGASGNPENSEADLQKQIEALTKRADRADAIAKLNDGQKAYFETLDDAGKDAFLAKSDDEKKTEVAAYEKAKEDDDPVVYKSADGEIFRKSDDPRMVTIAKRADEDRAELKKAREAAENARITNFVKTELGNLPGTEEAKISLVKATESIEDEKEREEALKALKAQNAGLSGAFKSVGSSDTPITVSADDQEAAQEELDKKARALMEKSEDGMGYYAAYDQVSAAHPELYEKAVGSAK